MDVTIIGAGGMDRALPARGRDRNVPSFRLLSHPLTPVRELAGARDHDALGELTPPEREVLALVAEGCSNAGIRQRLSISESALEQQLRGITTKLSLPDSDDVDRRVLAAITFIREEFAASRVRVIATADDARRQIERDLHDGAQQRLVTLAVSLQRVKAKIPPALDGLRADVTRVEEGLVSALDELRELSQGIHPAVLTEGGLSSALRLLARRSSVPVDLDLPFEDRLPDQVEVVAYYTVSEALTNASKHAEATCVSVALHIADDVLRLSIRDDGIGGADASLGSGLSGLRDRVEALGGTFQLVSPRRSGTHLYIEIPTSQTARCARGLQARSRALAGRINGERQKTGGATAAEVSGAVMNGSGPFGIVAQAPSGERVGAAPSPFKADLA